MKTVMLTVLAGGLALHACSQKISVDKVPQNVKEAFDKAHPGTKGKWEKEEANYEVSFEKGKEEGSCLINAGGDILETEMEISVSALPAAVVSYVQQHHGKAKIKEAAKLTKANGEVMYEAEVGGKDLLFDSAGKFLQVHGEKNG